MAEPGARLFLERRSYQRRRLIDAARLLPFAGLALWLIPLAWSAGTPEGAGGVDLARAGVYVFGVWAGLIGAGALLSMLFGPAAEAGELPESDEPPEPARAER